jgi:hypothetical protein
LGDAGTSFFRANATIKHRKNLITQLVLNNGSIASSHKDKELAIWEDFKVRLGLVYPAYFINRDDSLNTLDPSPAWK